MRVLLLFSFILIACSSSAPRFQLKTNSLAPDLDIGEYLYRASDGRYLTVARDSKNDRIQGIVALNLAKNSWETLVKEAHDAKDIFEDQGSIAYRINSQVMIHTKTDLNLPVKNLVKLRAFFQLPKTWHVSFSRKDGSNGSFCVSDDGQILNEIEHPLPIIAKRYNNEIYYLLSSADSVLLSHFQDCETGFDKTIEIQRGVNSKYANFIIDGDKWFSVYMNEKSGVLLWSEGSLSGGPKASGKVEGDPKQSYVGMDIEFFKDGDKPGLIYLDGLELKPKIARWRNGSWQVEELPIPGASGFYNQLVDSDKRRLRFLTHAFRNSAGSKVTFEDLLLVELSWSQKPSE